MLTNVRLKALVINYVRIPTDHTVATALMVTARKDSDVMP